MTDEIKGTSIIPTADTIERNKALIRRAVETCDDWFIHNREHFISKAKIIGQKNQACDEEDQRLNPTQYCTFKDPQSGIWYPDETKTFRPRQEPSIFDPIRACYGGKFLTRQRPLTHQTERITRYSRMPANKEDALLVYYALLICLHDGTAIERGFPDPITKTIWSSPGGVANSWPEFVTRVYYPECMDDDRADFIEAALRYVGADLQGQKPPEKGKDETQKRTHSIDFSSVVWNGKPYSFTPSQATAVGLLWAEYEKGTWILREKTIGEKVNDGIENYRLRQTFENGKHPAWGTFIIPGSTKGTFRLADTIQQKPTFQKKSVNKSKKK